MLKDAALMLKPSCLNLGHSSTHLKLSHVNRNLSSTHCKDLALKV